MLSGRLPSSQSSPSPARACAFSFEGFWLSLSHYYLSPFPRLRKPLITARFKKKKKNGRGEAEKGRRTGRRPGISAFEQNKAHVRGMVTGEPSPRVGRKRTHPERKKCTLFSSPRVLALEA